MIKLFSEEEHPELFHIVDETHEFLLERCPKYNQYYDTIHITTLDEMRPNMDGITTSFDKGFGYSINNHFRSGTKIRIIVINTVECIKADITLNEYKALILHELGHLLNWYEPDPVPHYLYCYLNNIEYNINSENDTKIINKQNNEKYADYYAKHFGYGEALISSFNKHNLNFEESFGFYDLRVESILKNKVYEGVVKPVK